jgi:4'-phosphopantetheinyl transferase EntD
MNQYPASSLRSQKTQSTFIADWDVALTVSYPDLYFFGCRFNQDLFVLEHAHKLGVTVPESMLRAVAKRKAEFVAGRYCAQQCFAFYDIPLVDILVGKNREPLWPQTIQASITHSDGYALCVAGSPQVYDGLGVDMESIMPAARAMKLQEQIVTDDEVALSLHYKMPHHFFVTLAFSAKESLFKAIYKDVGRFFGFDAANVTGINSEKNEVVLTLTETLTEYHYAGRDYTCHFWDLGERLITLIARHIND